MKISPLFFVTFFLFISPNFSQAQISYQAPEISGIEKWFNSKPLKISDLKGKVVLVDFWTYSCINCLRTLPHIIELDEKYKNKGLVIIGIHAPEFDFEKNPQNVEKALKKFGIKYAVALDNNLTTWNNFNNRYWPAHYLINQNGEVVYTHFGEGEYDVMENKVRALLALDAKAMTKNTENNFSEKQTPETYLGFERSERKSEATKLPIHHWKLQGNWKINSQFIEAKNAGDSLQLNFFARKVFLVMSSTSGKEISAEIFLDGKENKIVKVKDSQLYEIVEMKKAGNALVEIKAGNAGLRAYAFTFGN